MSNRAFRFLQVRFTKLTRNQQNSMESRARSKEILRKYHLIVSNRIGFAPSTPDASGGNAAERS